MPHVGASIEQSVPEAETDRPGSTSSVNPQRPGAAALRRRLAPDDEVDVPATNWHVAVVAENGAGAKHAEIRERPRRAVSGYLPYDRGELAAQEAQHRLVVEQRAARAPSIAAEQVSLRFEAAIVLADCGEEDRGEDTAQRDAMIGA